MDCSDDPVRRAPCLCSVDQLGFLSRARSACSGGTYATAGASTCSCTFDNRRGLPGTVSALIRVVDLFESLLRRTFFRGSCSLLPEHLQRQSGVLLYRLPHRQHQRQRCVDVHLQRWLRFVRRRLHPSVWPYVVVLADPCPLRRALWSTKWLTVRCLLMLAQRCVDRQCARLDRSAPAVTRPARVRLHSASGLTERH